MDCAGQYAANLERFLRGLPLELAISIGEPGRNAAYRKAHFPKRKSDASDSTAAARYAVVEQPKPTLDMPEEFAALREVASRLESQVVQTTRFVCQLHNLLARVFPELATIVADLRAQWVLALLAQYPTPARLARAKRESLEAIPYVKRGKIAAIQAAAQSSVGVLRGTIAESLVVQLVHAIESSKKTEKRLMGLMKQAFDALPAGSHQLLTTIKGIGPTTAAAIVAKVVSIDRFAAPAQLVSYFGVFPSEHTSGYDREGKLLPPRSMRMSQQGNDLVRRCLWMAAQTAAMHNPAVRALYARQRSRGKRGDVHARPLHAQAAASGVCRLEERPAVRPQSLFLGPVRVGPPRRSDPRNQSRKCRKPHGGANPRSESGHCGNSQRRPRYNSRQRAGASATPAHRLCVPPPTNHDGTNLARTRLAVAAQGNAASVTRSVPDSRWKRLPTSLLLGSPVKTDLPLLPRRVFGPRKRAGPLGRRPSSTAL